jgi:hypothetical protein
VDGYERSALDLIRRDWVLLARDDQWRSAATQVGDKLGIGVDFEQVGADVLFEDPAAFEHAYGVGPAGATLIRPDGYIAWRTGSAPSDRAEALADALAAVAAATRAETASTAPQSVTRQWNPPTSPAHVPAHPDNAADGRRR